MAGVATLLATPTLFASLGTGTLTITAPGLAHGDINGPYNVVSTPVTGPNLGNFETFCLAYTVDYYNGGKYNYNISTKVEPQYGNLGGTGLGYITLGTAWLYSQYRSGNVQLTGYNDAIQEVIWYLQGQTSGANPSPTSAPDYSYILGLVNGAKGANVLNDADGAYNVYALNLLIGDGTGYAPAAPGDADGYAQPQLCMVPVPEPGTIIAGTLVLLPFGISTFRILRKRKQNQ